MRSPRVEWCFLYTVVTCWLLCLNVAHATDTLVWQENQIPDRLSIQAHTDYLVPGMQHLTITDVVALPDERWTPAMHMPRSMSFAPRQTLWYRIALKNTTNQPLALVLINYSPAADTTDGFLVDGSAHAQQPIVLARAHDASNRLRLNLPAGHSSTLYLNITGFHGNNSSFELLPAPVFERKLLNRHWLFGLINGAIIGLLLYSTLVWLSTRQQEYFAYTVAAFTNFLAILPYQTINAINDILPRATITNLALVLPLTVSASLIWFFRSFSETAVHRPKLNTVLMVHSLLILCIVVLFLIGTPMLITTPLFAVLGTSSGLIMIYITARMNWLSRTIKLLMLTALLLPVIGILLVGFMITTWIKQPVDYILLMQSIEAGKLLALALALAFKVRDVQQTHKKLQDDAAKKDTVQTAQNRLLAHLNHEFRTPLNGIQAAAELLLSRHKAKTDNTVDLIYQTALSLKILIEDLVDIDSLSHPKTVAVDVRFSIEKLLQECCDLFLPAARKQQVRLFFFIDHDVPIDVSGQPNLLRQILLNLLGNAFKFTRNGVIGIRVYRNPGDSQLLRFDVYDDGDPIPKTLQARLFHQFEQGTSGTSAKPGTGLGLSIVQSLSQRLGGQCGYRLYDEQQPDLGKLFWFTLRVSAYWPVHRTRQACFDNRRVLIADTHPVLANVCREAISAQAAFTQQVSNLTALRETVIRSHFDLVIIQKALLGTTFDAAFLEDVPHVVIHDDGDTAAPDTVLHWPVITRSASIRKWLFQIASQVQQRNALPRDALAIIANNAIRPLIMIVEDNPTNQIILSEVLKRFPVNIEIFNNGQLAESAFLAKAKQQTRYVCIFMDCEMPVQDGFDTTRHIREHERQHQLPHTPIIAVTAHSETGHRELSLQAGMDSYLNKPVSVVQIQRCLQQLGLVP